MPVVRTLIKKKVNSFTSRKLVLLVLRIDSCLTASEKRVSSLLLDLTDDLL